MELWQVGLFLGVGDRDPVIRGTRSLHLPSDTGPARPGQPRTPLHPQADRSLKARIAAYRKQKGGDDA